MSEGSTAVAVVSDLHLGDGSGDPFAEDDRFAETVMRLLAGAAGRRFHLVLLGDVFDFPAVHLTGRPRDPATGSADAAAKFARITEAHPAVVAALREVVAAGQTVDVVAGNHDMELLFPAVRKLLLAALDGGPGTVRLHPWMLFLPGLLYAEHGQQHHDINRFPWLGAWWPGEGDRLPVPPGSYLDALAHLRGDVTGAAAAREGVRLARGVAGGLAALARAEHRRAARDAALTRANLAELPPAAVLGIDAAAAATPGSIVRRAAAMAAARIPGRPPSSPYMLEAARRVHRVLVAAGCAVPFYVTGHTHVCADAPLDEDGGARYLNAGTWSSLTRRGVADPRRCGVVLIEQEPGRPPTARVSDVLPA